MTGSANSTQVSFSGGDVGAGGTVWMNPNATTTGKTLPRYISTVVVYLILNGYKIAKKNTAKNI